MEGKLVETWVRRSRDGIPVKVYLNHLVLIVRLFRVRDAIFVLSSVVHCGNVPTVKKSPGLSPTLVIKWAYPGLSSFYFRLFYILQLTDNFC